MSTATKNKIQTKEIAFVGLFAAIIAICAQIQFPIFQVPITLQTFAIALAGYFLSAKYSTFSTIVYILLGSIGLPVFAGFKGGLNVLVGYTGGFLLGFIFMAFLCGLSNKFDNMFISILLGIAGLIIVHLLGVIYFSFVLKKDFYSSFLLASFPFLIKDVVSIVLAYFIATNVKKRVTFFN